MKVVGSKMENEAFDLVQRIFIVCFSCKVLSYFSYFIDLYSISSVEEEEGGGGWGGREGRGGRGEEETLLEVPPHNFHLYLINNTQENTELQERLRNIDTLNEMGAPRLRKIGRVDSVLVVPAAQ